MNTETLRRHWSEGKTSYNIFLTIPSPWTAELITHSGWETFTIDMQHGLMTFDATLAMLQAAAPTGATPFIRLPWNDPAITMKVLDAGAAGVICPMINTAEDVERFVAACRYPPMGYRSYGPIRAKHHTEGNYFAEANEQVLAFAMIETADAVANLEKIAAVRGLDGLFIGPFDLSVSLGLDRIADFSDPGLNEVFQRVLERCAEHDLLSGVFTSKVEDAEKVAEMGFNLVTCGDDSSILEQAVKGRREELG
jgi:4-hydroxy-2-oxoheptanedioate aldolase